MLIAKRKSSCSNIMFKLFGMTWQRIEHTTSGTQGGRSSDLATAPVNSQVIGLLISDALTIWASAWQTQQNGLATQGRVRLTWIFTVSSVWLRTRWVAKGPRFLHADNENGSDWAYAQVTARGTRVILLILSCDGSYMQRPLGPITVAPQ